MTEDTRTELSLELGGKTITIETGELAKQADGSVLLRLGDTVVMVSATMGNQPRQGIDFFPLVVDYEERMYAAGKIPGGFIKREGRPTEKAILTSRLVDRPIRPLFPYGMRHEVQVVGMPLSVDTENPPDILAMIGASAALTISKIPFGGPIGAVRVGRVNGEFIINPTFQQLEESDMDLVVAGTREAVTTIEAGMMEVPEEDVIAAINFGYQAYLPTIDLQEELARKVGATKAVVPLVTVDAELVQAVRESAAEEIFNAIQQADKASREEGISLLRDEIVGRLAPNYPERESELGEAVEKVVKEQIRRLIMEYGKRPDGRDMEQIRPLSGRVGFLPRTHGSGLFTRGQSQVCASTTLGPLGEAQSLDGLTLEESKRYMHQYNFPPYSVGETRPLRGPGRREIGHGALAERALRDMIPDPEEFPYAIRVVSEVLESNGSTSMASVCASTLSLMDAGVQLKAPVAGIAMGLMTEGEQYKVLTDIQGMEDFSGDMDFKVAGTRQGITALQMDCKIKGVSTDILAAALEPARRARLFILDKIREILPAAREELSPYAPRVIIVEIDPEKIGDVIGPGGKIIKKIQLETGTKIDIEQTGKVFIAAVDAEQGEKARQMVLSITAEAVPGQTYPGKVTRLTSFGAFMEILPGKEGLLRLNEYSPNPPARIEDVVKLGDEFPVNVLEIDFQGRVNLTRRGLLTPEENTEMSQRPPEARRPSGGDRGGDRGGRDRGGRGGDRGGPRGGDHGGSSEGPGVQTEFRPPRGR